VKIRYLKSRYYPRVRRIENFNGVGKVGLSKTETRIVGAISIAGIILIVVAPRFLAGIDPGDAGGQEQVPPERLQLISELTEEPITVKEMRLGMKEQEFNGVIWKGGFTIAGHTPSSNAIYNEKGLSELMNFSFDRSEFDDLREAVLTKYPKTECSQSVLKLAVGVELPQIECVYRTKSEVLSLTKYGDNIRWWKQTNLTVESQAHMDRVAAEAEQKRKAAFLAAHNDM
jgi:hypothetical protein